MSRHPSPSSPQDVSHPFVQSLHWRCSRTKRSVTSGLSDGLSCCGSTCVQVALIYLLMAKKCQSSDADNRDTPMRIHKVLPFSKKVRMYRKNQYSTLRECYYPVSGVHWGSWTHPPGTGGSVYKYICQYICYIYLGIRTFNINYLLRLNVGD